MTKQSNHHIGSLLKRFIPPILFIILLLDNRISWFSPQVTRKAELFTPTELLLTGALILSIYFLIKRYAFLQSKKGKSTETDTSRKADYFSLIQPKQDSSKRKDVGIGTGVVKIFQQIKDNLADFSSLSEGYRHLLSLSCEHLEFNSAAAYIIDQTGMMKLCGYFGLSPDKNKEYRLDGTGIVAEVFDYGFPRLVINPSKIQGNSKQLFEDYNAAWILPILPQGTHGGIIVFLLKEIPTQIEYYYPKLDFVGIAASWFCENHNNQLLIAKENNRNEMLVKTSLAISSSLDLDEVCDILVNQLGRYLSCSLGYILLNEGDSNDMYMQKFYSKRNKDIYRLENRNIDISEMSWLREIISLSSPILIETSDLESFPKKDLKTLQLHDSVNALIAPLKHAGKLSGILVMADQCDAGHSSLNKDVVDLSAALVAQSAAAIENARMYTTIKSKIAHITTMFDVGQALNSDLDLIPFFNRVLNAISKNFNISNCAFMLRDFDSNELYVVTMIGAYPSKLMGKRLKIGDEGITGYAAALGRTVNVGDVNKDKRFIPSTGKTASELAVPVILKGRVVGVLDVESDQKYAFSKREEELLESLMDQVAAAMERIKLKQQGYERANKLALTNALVKKLSSILDQNEMLGEAVRSISEGFGFDLVAVFIPDSDSNMRLAQQCCRIGQGYEPDLKLSPIRGTISEVLKYNRSVYVENISSLEHDVGIERIKSRYTLPLMAGRNFYGVLDIQDSRVGAFSQIDLSTLQTIAEFLAVTLNNMALYSKTTETAERLSLVDQISQAISATLDLEELFGRIVESLAEITGFHWATLVLKDEKSYHIESDYFIGYKYTKQEMPSFDSMEKYFKEIIIRAEPAYYNVHEIELDDSLRKFFARLDINYVAVLPINHKNKHIGFLLVGNPNPEGFRSQDYLLLYESSRHLEIAVSNAMLYGELKKAYNRVAETQEQLIQSEKFKALGEVAAGITHDFKNVLASIVGRVQMLNLIKDRNEEITPEMLYKNLEIIEKAASDGVNMLSRINEFTKSKSATKLTAIDLSDIIKDTVEMTRPKCEDVNTGKKIEVITDFRSNLSIKGNRSEIVEVFSNLIHNAVDAIKSEGIVKIEALEKSGYIYIKVADNGTGMDAEIVKRIFDPYFTTKGRLGIGLGLSMVYAIVNRHGGKISVDSTLGKGTVFTIKLAEMKDSVTKTEVSIMIVEDDGNLRSVLYDIFSEWSEDISLAENYSEASQILSNKTFDLVLTDLGLPDQDGWKIADLIQSTSPDCLIVPMTGWNEEINKQELMSRGLTEILKKPFNIQQVESLMNKLAQRKVDAEKIA